MGCSRTWPDFHRLSGRQTADIRNIHLIMKFNYRNVNFISSLLQDSSNTGNVHSGMVTCHVIKWFAFLVFLLCSLCFSMLVSPVDQHVYSLCVVGAVPPWLLDDPLEGTSGGAAHSEIGPSLQEFLKYSKNYVLFCFMEVRSVNFFTEAHSE